MRRIQPDFGDQILSEKLNSLGAYVLVTMEEPWEILKENLRKYPAKIIFNRDMSVENLEKIKNEINSDVDYIVGVGGGTSCDTAKYISWKKEIPLIISPSIISVDAWLCRSIAVRMDHKVRYIGEAIAEQYLVDYSLIKIAPKFLNWAGIADVISITSALGDWLIAKEEFNEKFDQIVFDKARKIAQTLILRANEIKNVSDEGIRALVNGQIDEVMLCEEWGNARPEEGGEHFLAYCLEKITHDHYIHGNIIALNVLVTLKLQRNQAVFEWNELQAFFDLIGIQYSPKKQSIRKGTYRRALESLQNYVSEENLAKGLWSLEQVFDKRGEYSIQGILDWIYAFD